MIFQSFLKGLWDNKMQAESNLEKSGMATGSGPSKLLPILMDETKANFTRCGDLAFEDVSLQSHPFLQYEGWEKVAFVSFILFSLATEVFLKAVLYKFVKSESIRERPITIIFVVDRVVQGSGYIITCILFLASLITDTPLVNLFDSEAAGFGLLWITLIAVSSRTGLSLCMAVYRIMYFKAPNVVRVWIGELNSVLLLITLNYALNGSLIYLWISSANGYSTFLNFAKGASRKQLEIINRYMGEEEDDAE